MIDKEKITAIVLCGGKGSRLQNQDKPLIELAGKRIIERILDQLQTQASHILISGSRNVAIYESLGHPVIVDEESEKGPLVGLTSAFNHVETEWALTTPGDVPFLASNLVKTLAPVAMRLGVSVPLVDGIRQNLCLLINQEQRIELQEFFRSGGTATKLWLDTQQGCETEMSLFADTFFNINTPSELEQAQALLKERTA